MLFFFIGVCCLLQFFELVFKPDYLCPQPFIGFSVFAQFVRSLDGFVSPVVSTVYQFRALQHRF